LARPVSPSRRKRKRKRPPPPKRAWSHSQKAPDCCHTYWHAYRQTCWSCQNDEYVKTSFGRAVLAGYGSVGASSWEPAKPARSVLECLEMAEAS